MAGDYIEKMNNKLFRCHECGGDVRMSTGHDRTFPYTANVALPIPADFEAPTCVRCNAMFLNDETWQRLEPIFNKLFAEFQAKHFVHDFQI